MILLDRIIIFLEDIFNGNYLGSRSPDWRRTRTEHIRKFPNCGCCGTKGTLTNRLNVHHVETFSRNPSRENDPTNLQTLCRRCHRLIGHLDSWQSFNSDTIKDAEYLLNKIRNRPK